MAISGVIITLASVGLGMLSIYDNVYSMLMILVVTVSLLTTIILSLFYLKTL